MYVSSINGGNKDYYLLLHDLRKLYIDNYYWETPCM